MQHTKNKTQKGSLLVEMIAVIGLISLITPILFHQIQRRNEEILDIQIATEMRAIKDALASYIQANEQELASEEDIAIYDGTKYIKKDPGCVSMDIDSTDTKFIPYFQGDTSVLDSYDFALCYHTVLQSGSETDPAIYGPATYRPVMYGVAIQNEPMPNLRRAAKVASLIGLEGGVVVDGVLTGMQGAWTEAGLSSVADAVGVVSSFDDISTSSLLKDVRWQHLQSQRKATAL